LQTNKHMKYIPPGLIFLRLIIGIAILILSCFKMEDYNIIAVVLFSVGLLTDIFDGIIARQLNIATQKLRRMDSTVDQLFFIMTAIATFIQCPFFFRNNAVELIILFSTEALTYIVCFIKFKKEIAIHAIASKIWTLILFATLIQVMLTCNSGILFHVCFYAGLLTRLEIIGILLLLRQWTNDVPSIYHAALLRQGRTIKKHKMFNS